MKQQNLRPRFRRAQRALCFSLGLAQLNPAFVPSASVPVLAQSVPDTCLAILTDISASVTREEFDLQKFGSANALQSPSVKKQIVDMGGLTVGYFHFSTEAKVELEFKDLLTASDVDDFIGRIKKVERESNMSHETGIGNALEFAIKELTSHCGDARRIIDIAGDGKNNNGEESRIARDKARELNIIINGLPIVHDEPDIAETYQKNVITGFLIVAEGFEEFQAAMERKLLQELAGNDNNNGRPHHGPWPFAANFLPWLARRSAHGKEAFEELAANDNGTNHRILKDRPQPVFAASSFLPQL